MKTLILSTALLLSIGAQAAQKPFPVKGYNTFSDQKEAVSIMYWNSERICMSRQPSRLARKVSEITYALYPKYYPTGVSATAYFVCE